MTRLLSEQPSRRGIVGTTRTLARPHRRVLLAGLVAVTLASTATIVAAALVGRLTDAALQGDERLAITLAIVALGVAVVEVVASGLGQAWMARAGEYVVRDLRDTMVVRLLAAPLRFVEQHRSGDLVQRGTAEAAALSTFVRDSLGRSVSTLTTLAAAIGVLAIESWQLLLAVVVGFGPASWWLMSRFRRVAGPAYAAEAAAEADVMAGVAEVVRTRSVLWQASPVGRRRLLADLDRRGDEALAAQMRTVVAARWVNAMALVEGLSLATLLVLGAALVAAGTLSIGVVVTFVLAGRTLFTSFAELSELVADAEEAATGVARAQDLLEATANPSAVAVRRPTDHRLVAEGLVFGYGEGAPVVDGLDLVVTPRDRVCLVGRTGAGKSTLAKLLAGLYRPDAGHVRLGGTDLADLPAAERARLVAYVPQQVQLGPGTIRDELRLADPAATDMRLHASSADLGLDEWVMGLPGGLDTLAAEGLSTGERQLVGILRVALSEAAVLVLDEATSDLDPRTAALVERALDRIAADRAVVVVAHRPETIAAFERVVDVERLVTSGSARRSS